MAASDSAPAGGREGPDPVPNNISFEPIDSNDPPDEYLLYDNRKGASEHAFMRVASTFVVDTREYC